MLDFFKRLKQEPSLEKQQSVPSTESKKKPRTKKATNNQITPRDLATQRGEPWIQVVNFEFDPNNMSNGAIELDYNDIFVARLVKAGYRGKDDQQIVDQWFTDVCRNIVMETFEQEMADPEKRTSSTNRRELGGGRSEFS